MTRGLFISFEGIDGAGKSTHIARVDELFRQAGSAVVLTREPGGTPVSEKLRELVLHDPMDPLTEALLMFAARREHLVQVIEPALATIFSAATPTYTPPEAEMLPKLATTRQPFSRSRWMAA